MRLFNNLFQLFQLFQLFLLFAAFCQNKQLIWASSVYGPFLEQVFFFYFLIRLESNLSSKKLTRKYKLAEFFEMIMAVHVGVLLLHK